MNETKPSCTTQLKVKSLLFQLGGYTLKWVDFELRREPLGHAPTH